MVPDASFSSSDAPFWDLWLLTSNDEDDDDSGTVANLKYEHQESFVHPSCILLARRIQQGYSVFSVDELQT